MRGTSEEVRDIRGGEGDIRGREGTSEEVREH